MSIVARIGELLRWLLSLLVALLPAGLAQRLRLRRFGDDHRRLLASQIDAAEAQRSALQKILADNRDTEFGRSHGFREITDEARYRLGVPVRGHEQLAPLLARQCAGEAGVLFAGPLLGVVGDRAAGRSRRYPIGDRALGHWQWVERLVRRAALARQPEAGGGGWLELLPVTPAEEGSLPALVGRSWIGEERSTPVPEVFSVVDEQARYYLLLRLALLEPVTVLRAWAPGTLAILAQHLEQLGGQLVDDIGSGRVAHLERLGQPAGASAAKLARAARPDPARAGALGRLLEEQGFLGPTRAWPGLRLLVCPTGGAARSAAERLPDRFGDLPVLDPGHHLPQAALTGPLEGDEGGPLLVEGQYWEFLEAGGELLEAGGAEPRPPSALRAGDRYRPVVTTAGGLYRHALDQLVEVVEQARGGGVPRLAPATSAGSCAVRPGADDEPIAGEAVAEAVAEASRQHEIGITGQTAWFGASYALGRAGEEGDQGREAGWLRRLLQGWSGDRTASAERPALNLVLEPVATLDEVVCRRLLHGIDEVLRDRCPAYGAARGRQRGLASPRALLLERGTFARRARRRVALGLPGAHVSQPPLQEQPPTLEDDEILAHVE